MSTSEQTGPRPVEGWMQPHSPTVWAVETMRPLDRRARLTRNCALYHCFIARDANGHEWRGYFTTPEIECAVICYEGTTVVAIDWCSSYEIALREWRRRIVERKENCAVVLCTAGK